MIGAQEEEMRQIRGNRIGIVFQEPVTSLNPLHSIEKQVGEVLHVHKGLNAGDVRQRVIELLAMVGLPDPEKRLTALPHGHCPAVSGSG